MNQELKKQAESIAVSALSDATGGYGRVCTKIAALTKNNAFFGPAVTVWTLPGDKNYYKTLLETVKAGDVVVIAAGGEKDIASVCKGFMDELAKKGVAAIAVDGSVMTLPESDTPVFALATHPKMLGYDAPYRINEPVSFGGAVVCAGDLVIGKPDGIYVLPQAQVESALKTAAKIAAAEAERIAAIG